GIGHETLRKLVRQAEVDSGQRQGVSSQEHAEIKKLKAANRRLREDVAILKAATTLSAGQLDPRNRAVPAVLTICGLRGLQSGRSAGSCESRAYRSLRARTGPGNRKTGPWPIGRSPMRWWWMRCVRPPGRPQPTLGVFSGAGSPRRVYMGGAR